MNEIFILIIVLLMFWLFFYKNKRVKQPDKNQQARKEKREELNQIRQREIQNDKNRVTKEQIKSILITLNLSPLVLELFDETKSLREFGFYDTFKPPNHIIDLTKKEQDTFEIDRYIPLFETMDGFLEVLAYDKISQGFIRYCPEDNIPLTEYEALNWDGVFVMQILTWYEDCKSDDEILNICNLLGLTYGKEILNSIKSDLGKKYTNEEIQKWEIKNSIKTGNKI